MFTDVGLNLRYFQFHFYHNVDFPSEFPLLVSSQFFFFFSSKGWFFLIRTFLGIFLQETEKQQSKLWGLEGLLVSSLAKPHPTPSFPLM